MKRISGIFILCVCLLACGKKFTNPEGNRFLAATVTASPLTIASDSLVTITGKGFSTDPDQDQVFFNGTGAAVLQASAAQLVVKAPAAGSTGNITVRVNGEQANGPVFTYPASSLFSMSPSNGVDSATITLTTAIRVGPVASTTVLFGNLPGKVLYTDSSRIIVSTPNGVQTGQLSIQTNGQQYAGPVFTRTTIQSITPSIQGAGNGVTMQIIGTGFNRVPNLNAVTFLNAANQAIPATIVKGSVDTLTVLVPAAAVTGPIAVNSNNQKAVTGPVFTLFAFTFSPTRSMVFPYITSSGFPHLLQGKGFNTDVSQNHVTINGLPCTVTYVSPTGDSIIYYLPDLVNPSVLGTANGVPVLQSGNLTATGMSSPAYLGTTITYHEVSTLAGGSYGVANGHGKKAQFKTLAGITYGHPTGAADYSSPTYFYVVDREANNVRRITGDGEVTLVAGSATGEAGFADGVGADARFNAPSGIALDNSGYLWIADSGNFRIRVIDLRTYQVITAAGTGVPGTADGNGSTAQFLGPTGVIQLSHCNYNCGLGVTVLISDAGGGTGSIRQLTRLDDGSVTITTVKSGLINPKIPSTNYYIDNQAVFNYATGNPFLGTPGTAGFMNGNPGLFNNPAWFANGTLPISVFNYLISDAGNNVIRVASADYTSPYSVGTYIGGMGSNTAGYQDGGFRTALFNKPGAMYVMPVTGGAFIYVCDVGNHAIRVVN